MMLNSVDDSWILRKVTDTYIPAVPDEELIVGVMYFKKINDWFWGHSWVQMWANI